MQTANFFNFSIFRLLIIGLLFQSDLSAQNIFNAEHRLKYANHLYACADYDLAGEEYLKTYRLSPENAFLPDSAFSAFAKAENYYRILELADSLPPEMSKSHKNRLLLIKASLKTDQFESAQIKIRQIEVEMPLPAERFQVALDILNENYKEPTAQFETDSIIQRLTKLSDSLSELKYRRPIVYKLLAVVLPGSGHFAAGKASTGMQYFMMVGINTLQAYKSSQVKGRSDFYPVVFLVAAGAFYTAQIHGAGQIIRRQNQIQKDRIKEEVFNILKDTGY